MNYLVISLYFFIALAGKSLWAAAENFVEIYVVPSSSEIIWTSPSRALRSTARSLAKSGPLNFDKSTYRSAIGHAMVHLVCQNEAGERFESWSGMSGESDVNYTRKLLTKDQIGLGILTYAYPDGYIQRPETVKEKLSSFKGRLERDRTGNLRRLEPRFIRFRLTGEECDKLRKYEEAFRDRMPEEKPSMDYVLLRSPLKRLYYGLNKNASELYRKNSLAGELGGGCTSYAVGFMNLFDVMTEQVNEIVTRSILYDQSLDGTTKKNVGLSQLLFLGSWNPAMKEPSELKELTFNDPEKIWKLLDGLMSCAGQESTHSPCPEQGQLLFPGFVLQGQATQKVESKTTTRTIEGTEYARPEHGF